VKWQRKASGNQHNESHSLASLYWKFAFIDIGIHDYESSSLLGWRELREIEFHRLRRQTPAFFQKSYKKAQQKRYRADA
jgi:hypothetical protein